MKERIKTGAIVFLLLLTVVLASKIWISPPPTGKKLIQATEPTLSESVTARMLPFSAIVNFGGGKHTAIYQLKNLWPFYRNILKQTISDKDEIKWARMDYKSYLKLHDEPSVVFELGNDTYSNLFKKIYGLDSLKGEILRLYFSEGEGVLFETDQGVYRTEKWTPLSDINQYIKTVERENMPEYNSLWERYGIPKAIYLPKEASIFEAGIVYRNELVDMKGTYRTDLIQRLLDAPIDDIHVIQEENSVLYVYGKRTVRLSDNGILDYRNSTDTTSVVTDPTGAIQLAYEFIAKTTGNVDDLYMQRVEAIENGSSKGYRVLMDYSEKGMSVMPIKGKPTHYIFLEVFNNRVEHMRYIYRNSVGEDTDTMAKALPFEEVMALHPNIFGTMEEGYDKALKGLNNFHIAYIDDADSITSPLRYGYVVEFKDHRYLFDAMTGALLGGEMQ